MLAFADMFSLCSTADDELGNDMRMRNLERLRTGGRGSLMTLSVPLPRTPDGRVYRFSPNPAAHPRHFLLGDFVEPVPAATAAMSARMMQQPRSPRTVCPYSGVVGDDAAFTHPDDVEAVTDVVRHAALTDAEEALTAMVKGFNSGSARGGLLNVSMSMETRRRLKPRFHRRDLLRELRCDHCGRDYGVYAIALFCPDCGAPNLRLHFSREVELVEGQLALAGGLSGQDELAYRLLGNAHEDVLTAYEATLKTVYIHAASVRAAEETVPSVGNAFQSIRGTRARFAEFDLDPFDRLSDDEMGSLSLNIQKRHVIGHNLGIIDAAFTRHERDARIGETVPLLTQDVSFFADTCRKVVEALDDWLGSGDGAPARQRPDGDADDGLRIGGVTTAGASEDGRNAAKLGMRADAYRLGFHLAATSAKGIAGPVSGEEVAAGLPDRDPADLVDALAELKAEGHVKTSSTIGSRVPHVNVELSLFLVFDPLVSDTDPEADAATLASTVLRMEGGVGAEALHATTPWTLRRFNPALGALLTLIDPGRVNRTISNDYAARSLHPNADDRVALRQYVKRIDG